MLISINPIINFDILILDVLSLHLCVLGRLFYVTALFEKTSTQDSLCRPCTKKGFAFVHNHGFLSNSTSTSSPNEALAVINV